MAPKYPWVKSLNRKIAEVAPVDAEREDWLSAILAGLAIAEERQEYHEGFMYWLDELDRYILINDVELAKEPHVRLAQLLYKHMTNLSHDSIIHNTCMKLFAMLLESAALTPKDLQLKWRPLYLLGRHYKSIGARVIRHGNEFIIMSLVEYERCMRFASPYFPEGATREIIAELSPRLCTTSVNFEAFTLYLALLPTRLSPGASPDDTIGLWAGPTLRFWSERAVGTESEAAIVRVLAGLSELWPDKVDWEPHLANLCTLLHRTLRLPVGKATGVMLPPMTSLGRNDASFLIEQLAGALIGCVMPGNTALQHLRRLLCLLVPYMHPSNAGHWQKSITTLLCHLLIKLNSRLVNELHGWPKETWWRVPSMETHISSVQREELFHMLLEPMFTLLHCPAQKNRIARYANLLCQLNPTAFLSRLFDDLLPALHDSSQPQRLSALLLMASSVGFAVVRHTPERVVPLLNSLLPHLELSNFYLPEALDVVYKLTIEISFDVQLEEFALHFTERVLSMADSLMQGSSYGIKFKRAVLLNEAIIAFMLTRGSADVQNILVSRLLAWMANAAYEPVGPVLDVIKLVSTFSSLVPATLIPWCIRQAAATVEAEGGAAVAREEAVSSKLLWDVAVLDSAVSTAGCMDTGRCLISGREQLALVLRCCLRARDRRLSQLTRHLLIELTGRSPLAETYPTVPLTTFQSLGWGDRRRLKELQIVWHEPQPDEVEFVQWMADQFVWPEVQLLQAHLDGSGKLERQELLRCATCLSEFAQTAWQILPPPLSPRDEAQPDGWGPLPGHPVSASLREGPRMPAHLANSGQPRMRLTLGGVQNARRVLFDVFYRLLRATEATDLSKVLQQAIVACCVLLLPGSGVGIASSMRAQQHLDVNFGDWTMELGRGRESCKRHQNRLVFFASLRAKLAWGRATVRLPELVADLTRLAGSPYRGVSTYAAAAALTLCTELGPLPSGFRLLAGALERMAGSNSEHQVLGCLTLMLGGTESDSTRLPELHLFSVPDWPARRVLCRCLATMQVSEHSNRPDVNNLIGSCVRLMKNNFYTLSCHDAGEVEALVSELTDLQARSTGWKCTRLTADSLQYVLHPSHPPPHRWLQFFLRLTLDVGPDRRQRAFANLAACVWQRKLRAARVPAPAPPPKADGAGLRATFVHPDHFGDGRDHLLPLPQPPATPFSIRDPSAPPDYAAASVPDDIRMILDFFADRAAWDTLLSLSLSQGGHDDDFLFSFGDFAACLTRVAGPAGAAVFRDPLTRLLAEPSESESHRASHGVGSVLWFALLAGTKHWLPADRTELHNRCLLPALLQSQASADRWADWHRACETQFERLRLDPAQLWPLADAIGERVTALSSAGGCTAAQYCLLFTVQHMLVQHGKWRHPNRMLKHLNDILHQLEVSFPESESVRLSRRLFISHCLDSQGNDVTSAFLAAFSDAPADGATFKTLLRALSSRLAVPRRPLGSLVSGSISPLCRAVQLSKTNEKQVRTCLQILAGALVLSRDSANLLERLSTALSDQTSWQCRRAAVDLMQGLAYHCAFQLNAARLRTLALERLLDPVTEVREGAAQALSGLLACGICDWDAGLSEQLRSQIASQDPLTRHAGVLGLCAGLSAHPYSVPDFLPDLVVSVCQLVHEPGPVGATASRAVQEFKRTHQDSWERDRDRFTPDQLSVLTDTTAQPGYYA